MENLENNKLIAEFMGMYKENNTLILPLGKDEYFIDLSDEDTFKFSTDWNWLMGVVEKIEGLKYFIQIDNIGVIISKENENIVVSNNRSKREAIYNACVEFIKLNRV